MPLITGRAIAGAGQRIAQNFMGGLSLEILYSFVIILCSLMIYKATKELYELSNHKGIKYFRLAFLFFAIAYFFRSFIRFFLIYFDVRAIHEISAKTFGTATLFIFLYFSTMAIFYLLYSVVWEKLNRSAVSIYIFHVFALSLSIIIVLFKSPAIYLIVNLALLAVALLIVFISHRAKTKTKKPHNLYIIYVLLSIFLVLNILDILIPNALKSYQLIIYLASIAIFLVILYKVLRKVG